MPKKPKGKIRIIFKDTPDKEARIERLAEMLLTKHRDVNQLADSPKSALQSIIPVQSITP